MRLPDYKLKPRHVGKLCVCSRPATHSKGCEPVCAWCFRIEFEMFTQSRCSKYKFQPQPQ